MSFSSCFGQEQGYAVFDSETGTLTFKYGTPPTGTYYSTDNTGTNIPGWYDISTSIEKVVFDSSFDNARPTSCVSWFYRCSNLTEIDGIGNLDTSNVTNMRAMFRDCGSLTSLDVSNFNTENVTDMREMFWECRSLKSLNLGSFNTANVTDMRSMFNGCHSLTTLNVSNFNTEKVTSMEGMFGGCPSLTSLDLSNFNTENVNNMGNMFGGCSSLTSLDLSKFNTEKVTDMSTMFNYCWRLTSLDVSKFNTANVTDMSYMFRWCSSLANLDVSNFNTAKVTDMRYMFSGCSSLTSLTFGENFTTASCTKFSNMFQGCGKMRYLDFYASNDDNTHAFKEANLNRNGASSTVLFGKEDNGLPLTTVIYMPHGIKKSDYTSYTGLPNLVFNDGGTLKAANYYSEDKVDIELPREFKTTKAEYSRTMKAATQYGTVILPYEFTTNESVQAYLLRDEHTGTMWYEEVESVPAHTPFFYSKKTESDKNVNFNKTVANYGITVEATHTTSKAEDGEPYDAASGMEGWTTKGYYITETVDASSGNTYYISGDKFWRATGTLKMYPHRVTYQGQWQYEPNATEAPAMLNVITMGASETGDDLPSEVSTAIEAAHLRSLQ
ncbi:MAG: BspA family leucine-rich repeat surface protein, partial [Prevotella sp.]|nr:BspA family leucine-rich repeat surface protein [Prevotella sp.]